MVTNFYKSNRVWLLLGSIAAVLYIFLLISSAAKLASHTGVIKGHIGPLQLFSISKLPAGNGLNQASIQFTNGSLIYWLIVTVLLVGLIYLQQRHHSHSAYAKNYLHKHVDKT